MAMMALGMVLIVLIGTVFFTGQRAARRRWWLDLDLPGEWRCRTVGQAQVLWLTGDAFGGQWFSREGDGRQIGGQWRVTTDGLEFSGLNGADVCLRVRRFADGTIGLHGGPWEYRVFRRAARTNVVSLDSVRSRKQ